MNTTFDSLSMSSVADTPAAAGKGGLGVFGYALRTLRAVGRAWESQQLIDLANRCEMQQPQLASELRAAAHRGLSA